jgi:hypothetical protein
MASTATRQASNSRRTANRRIVFQQRMHDPRTVDTYNTEVVGGHRRIRRALAARRGTRHCRSTEEVGGGSHGRFSFPAFTLGRSSPPGHQASGRLAVGRQTGVTQEQPLQSIPCQRR